MTKLTFSDKLVHIQKLLSSAITLAKKELDPGDKLIKKLESSLSRCNRQTFSVAIMAMAKSGKSTFINALLGNEFLPVSHKPETTIPVTISHSNEDPHGVLVANGEAVAEGAVDIISYIRNENEKRRSTQIATNVVLHLKAPIHAFRNEEMKYVKFEIIDTPGFGEKGETGNQLASENMEKMDEIGVVIYLLDYTKLNFQEEENVLTEILEKYHTLGQLKERLFFVITKIDNSETDARHNHDRNQTIDEVYKALKEKIKNLERSRIFAVSANNAILSRMILSNVASEVAFADFAKKIFGIRYQTKTIEDCRVEAQAFLDDYSFLPALENEILSKIYKNREKILFSTLISELEIHLKELENKFLTAEATLKADKDKIKQIEKDIEETKKKSSLLSNAAQKELNKIDRLIKNELDTLASDLRYFISDLTDGLSDTKSSSGKSEITKELDNINSAIVQYITGESKKFISNLKIKLAENQAELFEGFSELVRKEASLFEKELGKKLNIQLHSIRIVFANPKANVILDEVNKKLDSFIAKKSKEESYRVDTSTWSLFPSYESRIRTTESFNINRKALQKSWQEIIGKMNENLLNIATRFIESQVKTEIQKAENAFNVFMNEYLDIITYERDSKTKGGPDYINKRLQQIAERQAECNSIKVGIDNYINAEVYHE